MAPDQVIYFCWFGRSSRCASDYEVPDMEAQLCGLGQAYTLCQREPCYQHLGSILRKHPKGSAVCQLHSATVLGCQSNTSQMP